MAILPREITTVAGGLVFALSYLVFAFGRIPGTKIDRTAMAVIGGTLMVLLGILQPRQALDAVDFPTLILLLGMMLLAAGLNEAGFFAWLTDHTLNHLKPQHLLPAVILTSGLLSALLVNDVVCVILTPLVLDVTRRMRRAPLPYLLALATASNIGSVATITGNPQNILIASVSHISYVEFLLHLGPVALMGLVADFFILGWVFRKTLHQETPASTVPDKSAMQPGMNFRRMLWPLLILLLVSLAFFAGVNPALGAAAGASLLLVSRHTNARVLFSRVDVSLLVFFIGLFVVLAGGEIVGVNEKLLRLSEHLNLGNTVIFTGVVTLLSNLVSNVPAVLLLKPFVVHQGSTHAAWLLLAMASTLAGNLTITGSVANIIVVESARGEADVSFWQYLRVGVPVTLVTLLMGWCWLHFFGR
jgi:Na+/H+ antiporter NhaD/arsenite permease-like protein